MAIFGATVMPHNLYLHSALVQTRRIGETIEESARCRFNLLDSTLALNGALFVNAAILIMAAAVFFKHNIVVTEIQQAHQLLSPLLGTTLASVFVRRGFAVLRPVFHVHGHDGRPDRDGRFFAFRMQPWMRRAITRCLAIVPAALTIYMQAIEAPTTYSLEPGNPQYSAAVCRNPSSDVYRGREAHGSFPQPQNRPVARVDRHCRDSQSEHIPCQTTDQRMDREQWRAASVDLGDGDSDRWNTELDTLHDHILALAGPAKGSGRTCGGRFQRGIDACACRTHVFEDFGISRSQPPDRKALANAITLAKSHNAQVVLLHVEEGVTSRMYGPLASTAEITEGIAYFDEIAASLREQGVQADVRVQHGKSPAREIARAANELNPDLLIMAAHGHRGLKDLIFGTTINSVRHHVKVPILIVQA